MDDLQKTGVYMITNKVNGKVYVGSATQSFRGRWGQHKSYLRRNKHANRKLQNSWNKHGEKCFVFSVIEYTTPEDAVAREQFHIDRLDAVKHGYNLSPTAGSTRGTKWTEEMKKRKREYSNRPDIRMANSERQKSIHRRPEMKKAASERGKRQFASEESRKQKSEANKKTHRTPEYRQAAAERAKEIASREGQREKMSKATRKHWDSLSLEEREEWNNKRKASSRTPEFRNAARIRANLRFSSQEARDAVSVKSKITNGTPEARKAASEKTKLQFESIQARKNASVKTKAYWDSKTPEEKRARAELLHAGKARKKAKLILKQQSLPFS